ncbi:MAG: nuclear transport factor 2 family protein [Turneriella sp.]
MKTYWKLLLLCTVAVGATSCGTCDEELVLQKVNDLFLETDNRNWPAVQAIFDDSVVFDVTSMAGGKPQNLTPSDITGAWDQGLKKLKAIHHQTGNFRVKVTGNEATVFCYGTAHHYLPTKSRRNTRTFVGSYDFRLVKKKDWKISGFKFNLKFVDGNLNLEKES